MLSSKQLQIPSKISLLHVEQEVVGDERTVLQSVLEADTRREELLRLERELSRQIAAGQNDENTTQQLAEVYTELEARDSARAPAVAAKILAGLGFPESDQVRPTAEFSGGWRMRMALAQGLFLKPDLLMLDEPTNMLDMKVTVLPFASSLASLLYPYPGHLLAGKPPLLLGVHPLRRLPRPQLPQRRLHRHRPPRQQELPHFPRQLRQLREGSSSDTSRTRSH